MRSGLNAAIVLCLLLGSCLRVAGDESGEGVMSSIPQASADGGPVLEYVLLSTGVHFDGTKLTDLAADWNRRVDAAGYEIITANILTPQFSTNDFDLVWVVLWSSSKARDAGWSHWNAYQARDWQAEYASILQSPPAGVYSFATHWGYQTPGFSFKAGDSFFSSFYLCALRDSHDATDLEAFQTRYNAWVSHADGTGEYGYLTLQPHMPLPSVDFVWLDIFGSDAALQAGAARWSGSELESDWNVMASCDNYPFASIKIRS